MTRVPSLLPGSGGFLDRDDLPSRPPLRKEEPSHLHLDLLYRGIGLRHGGQGLWYCSEVDIRGQQSICPCVHLRLHDRDRLLHSHSDELL